MIQVDVPKKRHRDDAGPTPPETLVMVQGGCLINQLKIASK